MSDAEHLGKKYKKPFPLEERGKGFV